MTTMSEPPDGRDPLVELTDQARLDAAITDRQLERELRDRAADLATVTGTLRDLAEQAAVITLSTPSGRTFTGRLLAVALDHVVLATPGHQQVVVASDSVATVRPEPRAGALPPMGDRPPAQDLELVERLARWLEVRPRLAVAPRGPGDLIKGVLTAVGEDVISLRPDAGGPLIWVATAQVEAVARDA